MIPTPMRTLTAALCLLVTMGAAVVSQQPPPVRPPGEPPRVTEAPFDQAAAVAQLERQIAGKEDLPATEVFKNITQYKGVTAGRLLRIMDFGFSRGLGVTCTHCHVAGEWDSDQKATKQIARDMSRMTAAINTDLLKKIPNLRSSNPAINCTTCHRGQRRPALELPAAAGRGGLR
jgi:hypothetical protein